MTDKRTFTLDIPDTFEAYAAVYAPRRAAINGPEATEHYGVLFPVTDAPAALRNLIASRIRHTSGGAPYTPHAIATSKTPPQIMVGDGNEPDRAAFERLTMRAADRGIPRDILLRERPLRINITVYQFTDIRGAPRTGIALNAINILGDLTKSPPLDEAIRKLKDLFA